MVAAQLGCYHRFGVTQIEKFLSPGSVGQSQMPYFVNKQRSATLLQVDVLITITLEFGAVPFRIRRVTWQDIFLTD